MPLPALAVFRAISLLAAAPGTTAHVARMVKGTREWWSGKKLAVIGPTASGKDSLLSRLQNREIPRVHSLSPMGERVRSFRVKLSLSHRKTIDITCKGLANGLFFHPARAMTGVTPTQIDKCARVDGEHL
jgi:hypothetical protein